MKLKWIGFLIVNFAFILNASLSLCASKDDIDPNFRPTDPATTAAGVGAIGCQACLNNADPGPLHRRSKSSALSQQKGEASSKNGKTTR